jgi:hypothetical protein
MDTISGVVFNLRADYSMEAYHGRLKVTAINQIKQSKIVRVGNLFLSPSLSITLTLVIVEFCLYDSNRISGYFTCHLNSPCDTGQSCFT